LRESCRQPEAVFAPAPGENGGAVHVEAELGAENMVETGDSIKTLSELPHQTGPQELKVVN
jgi:hypothetical protein